MIDRDSAPPRSAREQSIYCDECGIHTALVGISRKCPIWVRLEALSPDQGPAMNRHHVVIRQCLRGLMPAWVAVCTCTWGSDPQRTKAAANNRGHEHKRSKA